MRDNTELVDGWIEDLSNRTKIAKEHLKELHEVILRICSVNIELIEFFERSGVIFDEINKLIKFYELYEYAESLIVEGGLIEKNKEPGPHEFVECRKGMFKQLFELDQEKFNILVTSNDGLSLLEIINCDGFNLNRLSSLTKEQLLDLTVDRHAVRWFVDNNYGTFTDLMDLNYGVILEEIGKLDLKSISNDLTPEKFKELPLWKMKFALTNFKDFKLLCDIGVKLYDNGEFTEYLKKYHKLGDFMQSLINLPAHESTGLQDLSGIPGFNLEHLLKLNTEILVFLIANPDVLDWIKKGTIQFEDIVDFFNKNVSLSYYASGKELNSWKKIVQSKIDFKRFSQLSPAKIILLLHGYQDTSKVKFTIDQVEKMDERKVEVMCDDFVCLDLLMQGGATSESLRSSDAEKLRILLSCDYYMVLKPLINKHGVTFNQLVNLEGDKLELLLCESGVEIFETLFVTLRQAPTEYLLSLDISKLRLLFNFESVSVLDELLGDIPNLEVRASYAADLFCLDSNKLAVILKNDTYKKTVNNGEHSIPIRQILLHIRYLKKNDKFESANKVWKSLINFLDKAETEPETYDDRKSIASSIDSLKSSLQSKKSCACVPFFSDRDWNIRGESVANDFTLTYLGADIRSVRR
ncbi:MAG: hypothetical protein CL816_08550 [Coxiellaceae bacterium]|nr:hypothetical protein [Coxiellaceae bacterium]|tara:strand:+ start:1242 stop:3152 length:1911 start_codon:yes stop_codon:yes gene_type:complete